MKSHWERGQEFVPLSNRTLTDLIQPAFPGRRVEDARPASGGLSNTNYRLVIAGEPGPVQLRLFVARPDFARAEIAIQRYVSHRLPVPEVLFHAGSNPVTGHPYAIFKWLDGIMLDALPAVASLQTIDDIARQLGVLLADMSSFRFPCTGFLDESLTVATPMSLNAEIFLGLIHHDLSAGPAAERLGAELTRALWQFVTSAAPLLDRPPGAACLVHGDFDGSNILVRPVAGEWQVVGLLDWEYALSASSLVDLGHILRPPFGDLASFEHHLIGGFLGRGGVLPDNWKRVALLIDLLNWVGFLARPRAGPRVVESARMMVGRTIQSA